MKKLIVFMLFIAVALVSPVNALAQSFQGQSEGIVNPVLDRYGNDSAGARSGSLLLTIISAILSFVMVIAALLVLMNLIEAAISWISSGGDSGKLQKARDRILHSVIGIIILSASVAVWGIVRQFLGISLDFSLLFPGNNGGAAIQAPRGNQGGVGERLQNLNQ